MLTRLTHIIAWTRLRRIRQLPVDGKVLVRKGQTVRPPDAVAEAILQPNHLRLDLSVGLNVLPGEVEGYLQVETGKTVSEQDILAGPVGVAHRVVRAPCDGRVALIRKEWLYLEIRSKPERLPAIYPGQVIELLPDRGVVIEFNGALLQGEWGNGQSASGVMHLLASQPGQELDLQAAGSELAGCVVAGGLLTNKQALERAESLGLVGLLVAGLAVALKPAVEKSPLAVLALEGFGRHGFPLPAYEILHASHGKQVILNACKPQPFQSIRPEAVIPGEDDSSVLMIEAAGYLETGRLVRVVGPEFYGAQGMLVEMLGPTRMPGGIIAPAAFVRLTAGQTITVAQVNLELLA